MHEKALEKIEAGLDEALGRVDDKALRDAMAYAVGTGGKRLRPLVAL